ncbi:MAG: helix-turn-helix domain-containing protein [Gammaproteobacteria bacterium]|nr:helix-turn-helix domain-containing protein [Gammaproteobacteria bacterium]MCH9715661.1 helix-turn-helix domain-containing protein [Gammaproteobacteria bacterium]MCH9763565.1 helix-turn-helix domain-containing protein [Gammaproteobacteria bacterium]
MNTTLTLGPDEVPLSDKPGATLAALREKAGHSAEYVASKLHLRVRVIELLEADAYDEMPEPVFIKGYVRAYANLLEIDSAPLLALFHACYREEESMSERTLWQSRKQTNPTEHWFRLGTGFFAVIVLIAVLGWWIQHKDVESLFSEHVKGADISALASETNIRLTDLSNMRSLLSSKQELPPTGFKDE